MFLHAPLESYPSHISPEGSTFLDYLNRSSSPRLEPPVGGLTHYMFIRCKTVSFGIFLVWFLQDCCISSLSPFYCWVIVHRVDVFSHSSWWQAVSSFWPWWIELHEHTGFFVVSWVGKYIEVKLLGHLLTVDIFFENLLSWSGDHIDDLDHLSFYRQGCRDSRVIFGVLLGTAV